MKQALLILIIGLIYSSIAVGQKQDKKYYYDKDWKKCEQSLAKYYRIISFDENGKAVGNVSDYYISGELQWKGYYSHVDTIENSNNVKDGKAIWYHKNGNKSCESNFIKGKMDGLTTFWNEKGKKTSEENYSNGKSVGSWIHFYENGEIYRKYNYLSEDLLDIKYIECDEFGSCQNVFSENFASAENLYSWPLVSNKKEYKSEIISEKGILMKTNTELGFSQTIHIPLNLTDKFSIETIVDFKSGEKDKGHGLIWGFKDWNNYFYFVISANGQYRYGAMTEGINIELKEWTRSKAINKNNQRNKLNILKIEEQIHFAINGHLVHSNDFYSFRGNYIGFTIFSGEKEVLFETLIVKQSIESELVNDEMLNGNYSEWKGNGTGFFISKNGYIVTNHHVISEASDIEINFIREGQKQTFKAKLIQSDKHNDLAILKIDNNSFVPFAELPFNFQTKLVDVGSKVFALGYPMALTVMGTEIKFTDGKISSKTGFRGDISTYQMTTPIQAGNSGGPLFSFDGNLIGVNSSIIRPDLADNVSYAIKSSYIKNLIDVLPVAFDLPNDKSLANLSLTEKIKILSDYVVLIKIK